MSADNVKLAVYDADGSQKAVLDTEMATTPRLRTKGLSGRPDLGEKQAMFFDTPGGFWMRGVNFPLNVAFLSKSGEVLDVQEMPQASEPPYPVYETEKDACYAVEYHTDVHIVPGDSIQALQEKQATPRWAKELPGLLRRGKTDPRAAAAAKRIMAMLPKGKVRQLGGPALGRGAQGVVYPSVTGGVGPTATKYIIPKRIGQFKELGPRHTVDLLKSDPSMFPRIHGQHPRGYTMERLVNPHLTAAEQQQRPAQLQAMADELSAAKARASRMIADVKALGNPRDPLHNMVKRYDRLGFDGARPIFMRPMWKDMLRHPLQLGKTVKARRLAGRAADAVADRSGLQYALRDATADHASGLHELDAHDVLRRLHKQLRAKDWVNNRGDWQRGDRDILDFGLLGYGSGDLHNIMQRADGTRVISDPIVRKSGLKSRALAGLRRRWSGKG